MSQFENLPQELRDNAKWCCWRYAPSSTNGKQGKVPFNPVDGNKAQSNNTGTFTDYQTALAAVFGYDGLGIGVFDDLAVIDIDNCVTADGAISDMAMDIIDTLDSYTEISPSGTGIRIIAKSHSIEFDKSRYYIHNQSLGLEIYIAGVTHKFLTVTGNVIRTTAVAERSEQLQTVLDKYMLRPAQVDTSDIEAYSHLTDDDVIRKASNAKTGEQFAKLWRGDISDYGSASEADMALVGSLAFWCGRDYEQMERLFYRSELGKRSKWTEREDYRNATLCTAIQNCRITYSPDYGKSNAADDFKSSSSELVLCKHTSLIKSAGEVASREVPWLIEGFLIRGALTSLQGLPDSGKSFLTCALAVAQANGGAFPKADGAMMRLTAGNVLIANFDDALEFGIKPRLEKLGLTAEGAKRISFLDPVAAAGITFDDFRLASVFDECKPDLAIFDTLQHFIGGKVDLHRANETNSAMAQLKLLAEKHNTAVVIVQHISKNAAGGNGGAITSTIY